MHRDSRPKRFETAPTTTPPLAEAINPTRVPAQSPLMGRRTLENPVRIVGDGQGRSSFNCWPTTVADSRLR